MQVGELSLARRHSLDAAGVSRVVIVPPSWEGDRNDLALAAVKSHPDRFAIMGRIDPVAPESRRKIATWKQQGETFKAEWAAELPEGEELTVYRQGAWFDMCRGPHLASTGKLDPQAFRLTRVSGAYWRGDQKNAMLSRIYGTGWLNRKQLDAHLHKLEEAAKRDHRRLGQEMDLFHLQQEAHGSVFWHPKGYLIWRELFYAQQPERGWKIDERKARRVALEKEKEREGVGMGRRGRLLSSSSSAHSPTSPTSPTLCHAPNWEEEGNDTAGEPSARIAHTRAPLSLDWEEMYKTRMELDRRWAHDEPKVMKIQGHEDRCVYCHATVFSSALYVR